MTRHAHTLGAIGTSDQNERAAPTTGAAMERATPRLAAEAAEASIVQSV